MNNQVRNRIVNLVNAHQGIKSTDLLSQLVTEFLGIEILDIRLELMSAIEDEVVMEVEYILPRSGASRSFFLPIGTEVRFLR